MFELIKKKVKEVKRQFTFFISLMLLFTISIILILKICSFPPYYRLSFNMKFLAAFIGLALALILQCTVGLKLTKCTKMSWEVKYPPKLRFFEVPDNQAARILGALEVILFYVSFLFCAWEVIGGWLVFKAASKWASWQHVMKMPEKIKGINEIKYIEFRFKWSSMQLSSFLVGTLCNVVASVIGIIIFKCLNKGYALFICTYFQ